MSIVCVCALSVAAPCRRPRDFTNRRWPSSRQAKVVTMVFSTQALATGRHNRKPVQYYRSSHAAPHANARRRNGVVTLELILAFPILFTLLLVIIEFGLIFSASSHVSAASRLGAKVASKAGTVAGLQALMPPVSSSPGPLATEINRYLTSAGFVTSACQVTLQYNNGGNQVLTDPSGGGTCNCSAPTANFPPTNYVRVTVCVPLSQNVPDLLTMFGFSLTNRSLEHTTTFQLQ